MYDPTSDHVALADAVMSLALAYDRVGAVENTELLVSLCHDLVVDSTDSDPVASMFSGVPYVYSCLDAKCACNRPNLVRIRPWGAMSATYP